MATHSDPDRLDELALRAGADIRLPLLRTLVDLYLEKPAHSDEEAQHFTELALRLLDQADAATRAAVARRLAAYPSAPAAIMARLAEAEQPAPAAAAAALPEPVALTELAEIFFTANAAERALILVNLAYAPAATAAAQTRSDGRDAARQLEAAALAHNPDAFARVIERCLGLTPVLARRVVHDPLGEPIVVVAKVLGLAADALQRILLFINPAVGRSVSRVYELALLFDTIEAGAAQALVAIWRAAEPAVPARAVTPRSVAERPPRRTAPSTTVAQQSSEAPRLAKRGR
jgi:hypothetical protein